MAVFSDYWRRLSSKTGWHRGSIIWAGINGAPTRAESVDVPARANCYRRNRESLIHMNVSAAPNVYIFALVEHRKGCSKLKKRINEPTRRITQ